MNKVSAQCTFAIASESALIFASIASWSALAYYKHKSKNKYKTPIQKQQTNNWCKQNLCCFGIRISHFLSPIIIIILITNLEKNQIDH